MVFLEYVDTVGHDVIYDYMPNDKNSDRGRISVNIDNGTRTLISKSKDDESSWFRMNAFNAVSDMIKKGDLKKFACIAWC